MWEAWIRARSNFKSDLRINGRDLISLGLPWDVDHAGKPGYPCEASQVDERIEVAQVQIFVPLLPNQVSYCVVKGTEHKDHEKGDHNAVPANQDLVGLLKGDLVILWGELGGQTASQGGHRSVDWVYRDDLRHLVRLLSGI